MEAQTSSKKKSERKHDSTVDSIEQEQKLDSSLESNSAWQQLQAAYEEIKQKYTFETKALSVKEKLDKIMSGTVDKAKDIIAALNLKPLEQLSTESSVEVVQPPVAKKAKSESGRTSAGDCRGLIAELESLINWPSEKKNGTFVKLSLVDANDFDIVLARPLQNREDFVSWLSNSNAKIKDAHFLTVTVENRTERLALDRDIAIEQVRAEWKGIIEVLELTEVPVEELVKNLLKEVSGESDDWYQPELVNTDIKHLSFDSAYREKQWALVISGESGSGKSQYAWHLKDQAKMDNEYFDAALYLTLNDYIDQDWWEIQAPSRSVANEELYCYLTKLFIPFLKTEEETDYSCVYDMLSDLNESRNNWAMTMLEKILQNYREDDKKKKSGLKLKLANWINGKYAYRLKSLLLVIDEVGRSLPFAYSLVDSVRVLQRIMFRQQAERVGLVLCGAGIEDVMSSNTKTSFGTDPSKSFVTMIGQPNLNVFSKLPFVEGVRPPSDCDGWNQDIHDGILHCLKQKGTRAQIMGTNMRLLRVGVLPALTCRLVSRDFKDNLEEEEKVGERARQLLRQKFLGCQESDEWMHYGIRRYMKLNGLQRETTNKRKVLLKHAFLYSLRKSLQVIKSHFGNESNTFLFSIDEMIKQLSGINNENLMRVGLVTSDPAKTSPAMKYLACEGHSLRVLPGEGKSFEELVEMHLKRYFECLNRKVSVYKLKIQVPVHMKEVDEAAINKLYNQLSKIEADLLVIVQPKENNAKGPDIMILDRQTETAQLDLYQVKNLKNPCNFAVRKVQESLFLGNQTSTKALESGMQAKIRNRYLQLSSPFISLLDNVGQIKDKLHIPGICVLPREVLQPSWDAFSVDQDNMILDDIEDTTCSTVKE